MATVISLFIVLFIGILLFKVFKKMILGIFITVVSLAFLCTLCIAMITKYSTIQERIDKYRVQYEKVLNSGTSKDIEEWNKLVDRIKERTEDIWTNIFMPKEVTESLKYIGK